MDSNDFFFKENEYEVIKEDVDGNQIQQLKLVGEQESDLNKLLSEVNHYVAKTKGTTDFAVIQNKVERMLTMRYEQSEAKLAFPTYLGLMGTFLGVLMGIFMFIWGFDGQGDVRDDAIKNLLIGILVSMSTSFIGLLLTTINNAFISEAKKLLCLQTESYHRALSKHSERFRSADGDEPLRYASRTLVILRTMKGLRLARAGR